MSIPIKLNLDMEQLKFITIVLVKAILSFDLYLNSTLFLIYRVIHGSFTKRRIDLFQTYSALELVIH